MLKENTYSTIIVVLKRLKLHKVFRKSLVVKIKFKTNVKRLEIIPCLQEKNAKLNNNKILTLQYYVLQ